jgi:hypothetical protein
LRISISTKAASQIWNPAIKTDIVIFRCAKQWIMDSWMKDETKYSEKDRKKLEKGSGCDKAWTLACNWLWRFLRW